MTVRVAVLGACGWMGKVHTLAYQSMPLLFGIENGSAQVTWLVDDDRAKLAVTGSTIPNVKVSTSWEEAISDPLVDLVDICLPDSLHYVVAKRALLAGKHVYCEKPLANTAAEAGELAQLAASSKRITRVGHSFPRNPIHDVAKDIIDKGEIGEIKLFRAAQHVDIMADPKAPFMWRCDAALAPTGIVGDTGSHVFAFLDRLVGRVSTLVADCNIVTAERPVVEGFNYGAVASPTDSGRTARVTNPDVANVLCRFENGAMGVIDFSRVATGRKFLQTYEIYGTRGSLVYNYDEINRIRFYSSDDPRGRQGFREIDVGPENRNYAAFLPIPNFGLGYNETKTIEVAEVIQSITSGVPMWPTFDNGHHIARIIDACLESSRQRAWVAV
jgi:predicted dehydrogenase